jgi:hypothetical protein
MGHWKMIPGGEGLISRWRWSITLVFHDDGWDVVDISYGFRSCLILIYNSQHCPVMLKRSPSVWNQNIRVRTVIFFPSFCQRRQHQHIFSILFLFSCVSALLFLCLLPFTWLSPGCPLLLLALLFPERVWLTGAYFFPCWLGHGTSVCCLRGRPVLSGLGTTYFWIQIEGRGTKKKGGGESGGGVTRIRRY